jgi:hypothetical protein
MDMIQKEISENNLKDLLIPFLVQLGYIQWDQKVKIDLGPFKDLGSKGKTIPLKITPEKGGVEVIYLT